MIAGYRSATKTPVFISFFRCYNNSCYSSFFQKEVPMDSINIRNAKLEDAPRILEIYAYYVENTVITFEYEVPRRIRKPDAQHHEKYPYLVIERNGKIEGYSYAGPFVGRAAYDWALRTHDLPGP